MKEKIVIEIEGGMVVGVYSTSDEIDVEIIDYDIKDDDRGEKTDEVCIDVMNGKMHKIYY